MPRRTLQLALLVLVGSSALAAPPLTTQVETISGPMPIDKTSQTEDVRFRSDFYERMTVPVRLSDTGPYRFLVDTGADRTAISRDLARKLNLRTGEGASLHSLAGVSAVATATVPRLELTRNVVSVIDAPLLDSVHMGADGILGVDSLRSQRVLFDFERQMMSIVPSRSREAANEPGSIVITARRRNGRLVLTEARANGRSVAVVLDTGAQISVINAALRRQLVGNRPTDASQRIDLTSVTGETIAAEYMTVRRLELGNVQLKDLIVVFADAHTFEALGLNDKPALLLGMNAMRAFKKVSIDFANRKLRVVLPEESRLEQHLAAARL